MKSEHIYTSDEKLARSGYGEWVKEPDLVEFTHEGIECKVSRVSIKEPFAKEEARFGDHLCGYVKIPEGYPYYDQHCADMDIDVHGGLTYGEGAEDNNWIGFDCGHSDDIIPSMKILREKYNISDSVMPIPKGFKKYSIFTPSYKNIDFCINECKSMAEQLNAIKVKE